MDQRELSAWAAGFIDGDGTVNAEVEKSGCGETGYQITPSCGLGHTYVSGIFGSEGSVGVKVSESSTSTLDYEAMPRAQLEHSECDALVKRLEEYTDCLGINGYIYFTDRHDENHQPQFRWEVNGVSDCGILFSDLKQHSLVKREQMEIMLNKILPMFEQGKNNHRRGFLEIMAWRDVLNSLKGGTRGKYNLEYFEEEWGMSLDMDRVDLPDGGMADDDRPQRNSRADY